MALSDYLSSDEWDACFYQQMGGPLAKDNFGETMDSTIDALLAKGYSFDGLNAVGDKLRQIDGSGNPEKICIFFGNPYAVNVLSILDSGRSFLKSIAPDLVNETDEEWSSQMAEAAGQ